MATGSPDALSGLREMPPELNQTWLRNLRLFFWALASGPAQVDWIRKRIRGIFGRAAANEQNRSDREIAVYFGGLSQRGAPK